MLSVFFACLLWIRYFNKMISDSTIQRIRRTSLYCALLLTSACAQLAPTAQLSTPLAETVHSAPEHLFADNGDFGDAPLIADEAELFQLTKAQRTEFLDYMNDPRIAHHPEYKRLYDYLEQSTYNFNYRGKTYLAQDAMSLKQGNCLSLAIMTTALAKTVGVRIAYQLIDTTPIFEVGDNAVAKGVHVRSKLYRTDLEREQDTDATSFSRSGIVVDYFPSQTKRFLGNITEQNFIARYYRNVAVEYLQDSDYNNSYWHALKAMDYAPHSEEGINLMAVIYKHAGYSGRAEKIYQYGVAVADSKLSLLKNYRQLLSEQNRHKEAQNLSEKIAKIDDPSPYNWLHIADAMLSKGNHKEALDYYKKAIDLAPYLQFGYLGLAKVYYFQGHFRRSEAMLKKAIERNYSPDNDQLYQAKLTALNSRRPSEINR